MKTQVHSLAARRFARHDRLPTGKASILRPDFEFQPPRFGGSFGGNDSPSGRSNFNRLAREVLRADASQSFRLERAVLGFVTLVSAWPIAIMIYEVIRLLSQSG
jgi:hypothetical protein